MFRTRKRPSASMVVAGVALISSFAGPAVADEVAQIAKHVTSKDVKNGSITGRDVKNGSITSKDVRNATVTFKDIKNGTVTNAELARDSVVGSTVRDGSLSGADLPANSLGGDQVDESSLQGVDAKTLNGKTADEIMSTAQVISGKAEMSVGDEPKTIAAFGGYRIVAACDTMTINESEVTSAKLRIFKDSEGISQVETWWNEDGNYSGDEEDEFTKGESRMIVREEANDNSEWDFRWEQYGPLNLYDADASVYLWGGSSAAGVNVGGHDCVLVFRTTKA